MFNITQYVRHSADFPLCTRLKSLYGQEIYFAENIKDFQDNRELEIPWWKRANVFLPSGISVSIIFHNVGIDACFVNKNLVDDVVRIHDFSGSFLAHWTEKGQLFPAEKTYLEYLENGELNQKDWVYQLSVWLPYQAKSPYIAYFIKNSFTRPQREKSSLTERILSLFPKCPNLQPRPQEGF